MKALSVRQPWAWAIVNAGKTCENRVWRCYYRGPLLIHAAKGMTPGEYDDGADFVRRVACVAVPERDQLARGGFVGVCRVVDCIRAPERAALQNPWFLGPYGIILDEVRAVEFFPWKGELGIFEVPDDLGRQIGALTP